MSRVSFVWHISITAGFCSEYRVCMGECLEWQEMILFKENCLAWILLLLLWAAHLRRHSIENKTSGRYAVASIQHSNVNWFDFTNDAFLSVAFYYQEFILIAMPNDLFTDNKYKLVQKTRQITSLRILYFWFFFSTNQWLRLFLSVHYNN